MDSEHPDYLPDIPDEDHHEPDDPGPEDNRNHSESNDPGPQDEQINSQVQTDQQARGKGLKTN